MPKSEASELTDDESQVGGVQSIQKEHEEGDPGGKSLWNVCQDSEGQWKDSGIYRWLEPMKCGTERENDSTDNTLRLQLGNMWVYKILEREVSKS